MSAADRRIAELLERWLASLELHASYLDLSNEDYGRAQAWPPHQRPTRWIIDLAKSRTADLRRMLEQHQAAGDQDFADALELMGFLTTLLGAEHVERFIPLATAPRHGQSAPKTAPPAARPATSASAGAAAKPVPAPKPASTIPVIAPVIEPLGNSGSARASTASTPRSAAPGRVIPAARAAAPVRVIPAASSHGGNDTTMMRISPAVAKGTASTSTRQRVTPSARTQNTGSQRAAAARSTGAKSGTSGARLNERLVNQVIADAVRMLDWGREWPQLAGLIARLADRPAEKEVWRILRAHKSTIEARAKPPAD